MAGYKKLFFPTSDLKNHFKTQFDTNRYNVIDSLRTDNYISINDDYRGDALYFEEFDKDSSINYKMIVAQFSNFPTYEYDFPELEYKDCVELCHSLDTGYTHKEIDSFKKGIFYCKKDYLEDLLKVAFEDIFFNKFPNGKIISVRLDSLYYRRCAMIRGLYSLENYPDIKDRISDFNGFETLRHWLFIESHESFGSILQLAEYFFFPFVTAFHCNYRIGLTFIFVPDAVLEHRVGTYPRDVLDYIRTGSDFGKEKIDGLNIENKHVYAKYCFDSSPLFSEYYEFIIWAINRANQFIKNYLNITNYVDKHDHSKIDPIYALEYNLSILHLIKIGLSVLSSSSSYFNKNMTFQSADILNDISNYTSLGIPGTPRNYEIFKRLFNKDEILPIISSIINSCSFSYKNQLNTVVENIYEELNKTIKDSVWLDYKVSGNDITVLNRDMTGDNIESLSIFTSNVIRALRNTHHGYLTRNDQGKRPARYLSMINGNIPDVFGSLTLVWLVCLIQDRDTFIGKP